MISYVPGGIEIPFEGIVNGAEINNDGHGWAVASRDGLEVGKSMSFDKAIDGFEEARNRHGKSSLGLFHSRWGTHGVMSEFNVHPFYVTKDPRNPDLTTVVAHNGVLPGKYHPLKSDPRSDTRVFVDRVLPDFLTEKGVPSRRGSQRLGSIIGSGNKLTFLSVADGVPRVRIVNAFLGVHSGGVWYSNDGYLPSRWYGRSTRLYGSGGGWNYDLWDDRPLNSCAPVEPEEFDWQEWSTCKFCDSKWTVDPDTSHCEVCETCQECWDTADRCECTTSYWSGRIVEDPEPEEVKNLPARVTEDKWYSGPDRAQWDY